MPTGGALIVLDKSGRTAGFQCVYHAWSYNWQGDLTGIAFEQGVKGRAACRLASTRPITGRVSCASHCSGGLVFGSFSDDVLAIDDHLDREIG